ncbi:MAG: cell division protein FtsX [Myxococcota bacterium]
MRQAVFVNVVAVLTIAIALFVVALFAGVTGQIRGLLDEWSADVVVAVYLEKEIEADLLGALREVVEARAGEGATIEEVTEEMALERLRSSLGEDADILEGLENNPLPASIEVRGGVAQQGPAALEGFAAHIEEMPGVAEVDYGRDWVGRLEGLLSLFAMAGMVLGGLILLAAMVTVSNTIKLAVFARKDEIEIMKLCGATDSFVRAPFLIEGLLQGLLGAVVAALGSGIVWLTLVPRLEHLLAQSFAVHLEMSLPAFAVVWLLLGGALLGLAGSALSLGRFLKV